jgi:ribonuclease P protein component
MRVRTVPAGEGLKVAFITSTKVFKKAVDRNRVKRRLRALVQGFLPEIPKNIHLLFIVRQEALAASHANLAAELKRLLAKISEALAKPPQLSPRARKMQIRPAAKA